MRDLHSLKRKTLTANLSFQCLHTYIWSGASLLLQQVHTLCLDLSPKCKTHAGSDEFVSQLQTNNGYVCIWCWQLWLLDRAFWWMLRSISGKVIFEKQVVKKHLIQMKKFSSANGLAMIVASLSKKKVCLMILLRTWWESLEN